MRCDARPHIRLAAAAAVCSGTTAFSAAQEEDMAEGVQDADGEKQPNEPVTVSLFGLDMHEFSLELLPRPWSIITSLDLSHNCLTQVAGIEKLVSLMELNLCRNELRNLPATCLFSLIWQNSMSAGTT